METGAELYLTDETNTEVDEEVFDELLRSGVKDFKADLRFQVLGKYAFFFFFIFLIMSLNVAFQLDTFSLRYSSGYCE